MDHRVLVLTFPNKNAREYFVCALWHQTRIQKHRSFPAASHSRCGFFVSMPEAHSLARCHGAFPLMAYLYAIL